MGNEANYWQPAIPYPAGEERGGEQVTCMKTFPVLQLGLCTCLDSILGLLLLTKGIKEMLTTTTRGLQPTLNLISYQVCKHLQKGPHTWSDAGESFPEF